MNVVFSGLTQPTSIRFSPDGRIFVAEKSGLIKVFSSLAATTPTIFADLSSEVDDYWDRGLLEIRPSIDDWSPVDGLIALRWGTLLLLRDWGNLPFSGFRAESVHSYAGELKENLKRVENDPNRWETFVGGGIPVVAFWTRNVGEAIGHLETLPLALSIPLGRSAR